MAFEIFTEKGTRTKEYISITDNKSFGLPRPFIDNQQITNKHSAILLFDTDTLQIGIHFTLSDSKIGIPVRIPNDKQGGTIAARAFFDLKKISPVLYSGRYDDFKKMNLRDLGIDRDGVAYVFELREKEKQIDITTESDDNIDEGDEPVNLDAIPF